MPVCLNFGSYLEPVKDVLLSHVSKHTLVNEGTVASNITLKRSCRKNNKNLTFHLDKVRVEGHLPHARELPGGAGLLFTFVRDGKVQRVGPHRDGLRHHGDAAVPDKPIIYHDLQCAMQLRFFDATDKLSVFSPF